MTYVIGGYLLFIGLALGIAVGTDIYKYGEAYRSTDTKNTGRMGKPVTLLLVGMVIANLVGGLYLLMPSMMCAPFSGMFSR